MRAQAQLLLGGRKKISGGLDQEIIIFRSLPFHLPPQDEAWRQFVKYSGAGRNLTHVLDDPELRSLMLHHIAEEVFSPEARSAVLPGSAAACLRCNNALLRLRASERGVLLLDDIDAFARPVGLCCCVGLFSYLATEIFACLRRPAPAGSVRVRPQATGRATAEGSASGAEEISNFVGVLCKSLLFSRSLLLPSFSPARAKGESVSNSLLLLASACRSRTSTARARASSGASF